jgi:hypothetical protein
VAQTIGGTDFRVSLTGPGTGYSGPTIGANPLNGHIVVGIAPAAAVPEPSMLTLAGTAAVTVAVYRWLRGRFGAAA